MRIATCAALVVGLAAAGAQASPYEGQPNPQYPDGTGDSQVDQLNAGQLNPPPPPGYGAPPPGYQPPPPPGYQQAAPAYGAPPPPPPQD